MLKPLMDEVTGVYHRQLMLEIFLVLDMVAKGESHTRINALLDERVLKSGGKRYLDLTAPWRSEGGEVMIPLSVTDEITLDGRRKGFCLFLDEPSLVRRIQLGAEIKGRIEKMTGASAFINKGEKWKEKFKAAIKEGKVERVTDQKPFTDAVANALTGKILSDEAVFVKDLLSLGELDMILFPSIIEGSKNITGEDDFLLGIATVRGDLKELGSIGLGEKDVIGYSKDLLAFLEGIDRRRIAGGLRSSLAAEYIFHEALEYVLSSGGTADGVAHGKARDMQRSVFPENYTGEGEGVLSEVLRIFIDTGASLGSRKRDSLMAIYGEVIEKKFPDTGKRTLDVSGSSDMYYPLIATDSTEITMMLDVPFSEEDPGFLAALKALGLKKESLTISRSTSISTVTFKWAYPGSAVKDRTVRFIDNDMAGITGDAIDVVISRNKKTVSQRTFPFAIRDRLSPNAVYLTDDPARKNTASMSDFFGDTFRALEFFDAARKKNTGLSGFERVIRHPGYSPKAKELSAELLDKGFVLEFPFTPGYLKNVPVTVVKNERRIAHRLIMDLAESSEKGGWYLMDAETNSKLNYISVLDDKESTSATLGDLTINIFRAKKKLQGAVKYCFSITQEDKGVIGHGGLLNFISEGTVAVRYDIHGLEETSGKEDHSGKGYGSKALVVLMAACLKDLFPLEGPLRRFTFNRFPWEDEARYRTPRLDKFVKLIERAGFRNDTFIIEETREGSEIRDLMDKIVKGENVRPLELRLKGAGHGEAKRKKEAVKKGGVDKRRKRPPQRKDGRKGEREDILPPKPKDDPRTLEECIAYVEYFMALIREKMADPEWQDYDRRMFQALTRVEHSIAAKAVEVMQKTGDMDIMEAMFDRAVTLIREPKMWKFHLEAFPDCYLLWKACMIKFGTGKYEEGLKIADWAMELAENYQKRTRVDMRPLKGNILAAKAQAAYRAGHPDKVEGFAGSAVRTLKEYLEKEGFTEETEMAQGDLLKGWQCLANHYIPYSKFAEARHEIDKLTEYMEEKQMFRDKELSLEIYRLASEIHIRCARFSRDSLTAAEGYLYKALKLSPASEELETLTGWLAFEKGDIEGAVGSLEKITVLGVGRRSSLMAIQLYTGAAYASKMPGKEALWERIIAMFGKFSAMEKTIADRQEVMASEKLDRVLDITGDCLNAALKGYGDMADAFRSTLRKCLAEEVYVAVPSTKMIFAYAARAQARGMTPDECVVEAAATGWLKDLLAGFVEKYFCAVTIEAEYAWYPSRDKDIFTAFLVAAIKSDDPAITAAMKLNMIAFLKLEDRPGLEAEKLLSMLDAYVDRSSSKKAGEIAKELEEALSPAVKTAKVKTLFEDGMYKDVIANAGKVVGRLGDEEVDVRTDLEKYMKASSLVLEADDKYSKGEFDIAWEKYLEALRAANEGNPCDTQKIDLRIGKAETMLRAFAQYRLDHYDEAETIAGGINDAASERFIKTIAEVRKILGLIGGSPIRRDVTRAIRMAAELSSKNPNDPHLDEVKASCAGALKAVEARERSFLEKLEEIRQYLALNKLDDASRLLDEILAYGYNRDAMILLIDAAGKAAGSGRFETALKLVKQGLLLMDQGNALKNKLLAIGKKAKGALAAERLSHHQNIISAEFETDNLRTARKTQEYGIKRRDRNFLEYDYDRVDKDPDTGMVTIRGFSFLSAKNGPRGGEPVSLSPKNAVTKGESYVVVDSSGGSNVLVYLRAVDVRDEHAVFEITDTADIDRELKLIPEKGKLRKVSDPSLRLRRDLLAKMRRNIERSADNGKIEEEPEAGTDLLDMALGFRAPVRGAPATGAENPIEFLDKRIKSDPAQNAAVKAALDPKKPFNLIQGPPGTGKTSVIIELARQYSLRGKKVLIVSQSNAGVDNVGIRFEEMNKSGAGIKFARVGRNPDSIDPALRHVWEKKKEILSDMQKAGSGCIVLGTTNGFLLDTDINTSGYYSDGYDLVIVEEAGRATVAETLLPVSKARPWSGKVVLVGDHKQLPAYGIDDEKIDDIIETLPALGTMSEVWLRKVFSRERVKEYKRSLFQTLWEEMPLFRDGEEKHLLRVNRRSHPFITGLVSRLFYGGEILADDPASHLPLEKDTIKLIDYTRNEDVRDVGAGREIYEEKTTTSFRNTREAGLVIEEFERYLSQREASGNFRYGVGDITVVTPYKMQKAFIRKLFEVKAVLNDIFAGEPGAAEIFAQEKLEKIERFINAHSYGIQRNKAIAALESLKNAYEDKLRTARLIGDIVSALPCRLNFTRGERYFTYDELKKLGLFEVETVDSMQGSENKAVILSLVRSNRDGEIGFMGTEEGLQRLTVAFSRARQKMSVIGDFTHTLTPLRNGQAAKTGERAETLRRAKKIFEGTVEYVTALEEKFSGNASDAPLPGGTARAESARDTVSGENKVRDIHRENERLAAFTRGIYPEIEVLNTLGTPVEISVDTALLSAISDEDLKADMGIWASLILSARDLKNVSFSFGLSGLYSKAQAAGDLEKERSAAPKAGYVIEELIKALRRGAVYAGVTPEEVEAIINSRIVEAGEVPQAHEGKDPVIIPVVSEKLLIWARSHGVTVNENEYPVAVVGFNSEEEGLAQIRNYEGALSVGLCKAALAIIKLNNEPRGSEDIKTRIMLKMNDLYKKLRGDEPFTPEMLGYLIDAGHKISRAIDLALPPVIVNSIAEIRKLRDMYKTYLQAA
ncbi:MAG: AAA family ATPase [Candidatus Omnitrophica bacterium]|nr:AAA family ATPase [Candidatus Omnitrophota bacterium]